MDNVSAAYSKGISADRKSSVSIHHSVRHERKARRWRARNLRTILFNDRERKENCSSGMLRRDEVRGDIREKRKKEKDKIRKKTRRTIRKWRREIKKTRKTRREGRKYKA
jgi:hypothetical protein